MSYHLTPKGHAEKRRLTLDMVMCTVGSNSDLKKLISERLLEMKREGEIVSFFTDWGRDGNRLHEPSGHQP